MLFLPMTNPLFLKVYTLNIFFKTFLHFFSNFKVLPKLKMNTAQNATLFGWSFLQWPKCYIFLRLYYSFGDKCTFFWMNNFKFHLHFVHLIHLYRPKQLHHFNKDYWLHFLKIKEKNLAWKVASYNENSMLSQCVVRDVISDINWWLVLVQPYSIKGLQERTIKKLMLK